MILNSVFEDVVVANSDEVFEGCVFKSGTTAKQKGVFGLSITGNANVVVRNCKFENKGYSAIYMNSNGRIDIENNEFDCTGLYNPIEGNSGAGGQAQNNVTIKNNKFEGICGNNYINFYNIAEGAIFNIEDNVVVDMSQQSEIIRLSNIANHSATFNIKNMAYSYDMNTAFHEHWTKFILCQDYTGNQDFTKFEINIEGLECNGQEVKDAEKFPVGGMLCVYGMGGTFPTDNNPVINLK